MDKQNGTTMSKSEKDLSLETIATVNKCFAHTLETGEQEEVKLFLRLRKEARQKKAKTSQNQSYQ